MEEREYNFKFIVIGDVGVGKTSLLMRYVDELFDSKNDFGNIDFKIKTVDDFQDGKKGNIQIWDTAGQDRFKTIQSSCFRGANGILIVFDFGARVSFNNVDHWLREIEPYQFQNCQKIIVGNKWDLVLGNRNQVGLDEAKDVAQKLGISFIETSAKTGFQVDYMFMTMARQTLPLMDKRATADPLDLDKLKRKKSCNVM